MKVDHPNAYKLQRSKSTGNMDRTHFSTPSRVPKRKDIKKSSYYVWFLGAQECRGLRGEEYVRPVLKYFIEKEKEVEPLKVTLQVSNKGLKIIQNVPRKGSTAKFDIVKHFIPHHAITCVVQDENENDDVVSCILLIYNAVTKCPVHVHSYRCDSNETASILKSQLQILIDRPENQRKFSEIEARLEAKGLLPSGRSTSDGRSSESSGSWDRDSTLRKDRIAGLYDSLAAELREKLGSRKPSAPLLLPPRDYDTVSRKHGRLEGIEERRSRQISIVGVNGVVQHVRTPPFRDTYNREDSSGKSSGIGSDDAPSPLQDRTYDPHEIETRSSSGKFKYLYIFGKAQRGLVAGDWLLLKSTPIFILFFKKSKDTDLIFIFLGLSKNKHDGQMWYWCVLQ